jgi:hypothetical protein
MMKMNPKKSNIFPYRLDGARYNWKCFHAQYGTTGLWPLCLRQSKCVEQFVGEKKTSFRGLNPGSLIVEKNRRALP